MCTATEFRNNLKALEDTVNAMTYEGNNPSQFNTLKQNLLDIINGFVSLVTDNGLEINVRDVSLLNGLKNKYQALKECEVKDKAICQLLEGMAELLNKGIPPLKLSRWIPSAFIPVPEGQTLDQFVTNKVKQVTDRLNEKVTAFNSTVNNNDATQIPATSANQQAEQASSFSLLNKLREKGVNEIMTFYKQHLSKLESFITELVEHKKNLVFKQNIDDKTYRAELINRFNKLIEEIQILFKNLAILNLTITKYLKDLEKNEPVCEDNIKQLDGISPVLWDAQTVLASDKLPEPTDTLIQLIDLPARQVECWKAAWSIQQQNPSQDSWLSASAWWDWGKGLTAQVLAPVVPENVVNYIKPDYSVMRQLPIAVDNKIKCVNEKHHNLKNRLEVIKYERKLLVEIHEQIKGQQEGLAKSIQEFLPDSWDKKDEIDAQLNNIQSVITESVCNLKKPLNRLFAWLTGNAKLQAKLINIFNEAKEEIKQVQGSSLDVEMSTKCTKGTLNNLFNKINEEKLAKLVPKSTVGQIGNELAGINKIAARAA